MTSHVWLQAEGRAAVAVPNEEIKVKALQTVLGFIPSSITLAGYFVDVNEAAKCTIGATAVIAELRGNDPMLGTTNQKAIQVTGEHQGAGSAEGAEASGSGPRGGGDAVLQQVQCLSAKMDTLLEEQHRLHAEQRRLASKVQQSCGLVLLDLEAALRAPSDSAQVSRGDAGDFRQRIMEKYNNTPDANKEVKCTVLNRHLPAEFVVAGHLLPRRAQKYAEKLLGVDINHVRNGLLWASCVEHAFESQWLVFSSSSSPAASSSSSSTPSSPAVSHSSTAASAPATSSAPPVSSPQAASSAPAASAPPVSSPQAASSAPAVSAPPVSSPQAATVRFRAAAVKQRYTVHILDKAKLDTRLADTGQHKDDPDFRQLMGGTTWRAVHNQVVEFSDGAAPFQRALMIHARFALKRRRAADFPDDFQPEEHNFDIVSEMDEKELVNDWLDSLRALQDIPEEEQLLSGLRKAGKRRGGQRRNRQGKGGKGKGGKGKDGAHSGTK